MELYVLDAIDSWGRQFAAARIAEDVAWVNPDEVCVACLRPSNRQRKGPKTIVWIPGCDVLSDFVFPGASCEFIVTDRVKTAFEEAGLKGFVAWPVKLKPPPRRRSRHSVIVPWPYTGPPLWDIYVPTFVHIIPEASDVVYKGPCSACGRERYGAALDVDEFQYVVDRSSWDGADFMRPHERNVTFVTQRVVDVIQREGFTNVEWRRWGEIGDRATADMTRMRVEIEPPKDYGLAADVSERFAKMPASFPPLSEAKTARYPEPMAKLIEYLRMEAADEDLTADDLTFVCSAQVKDHKYWVWRLEDDTGALCYAVMSEDAQGRKAIGYDTADDLTLEQFLWADYHGWL
jgi:hypothetical protein